MNVVVAYFVTTPPDAIRLRIPFCPDCFFFLLFIFCQQSSHVYSWEILLILIVRFINISTILIKIRNSPPPQEIIIGRQPDDDLYHQQKVILHFFGHHYHPVQTLSDTLIFLCMFQHQTFRRPNLAHPHTDVR